MQTCYFFNNQIRIAQPAYVPVLTSLLDCIGLFSLLRLTVDGITGIVALAPRLVNEEHGVESLIVLGRTPSFETKPHDDNPADHNNEELSVKHDLISCAGVNKG